MSRCGWARGISETPHELIHLVGVALTVRQSRPVQAADDATLMAEQASVGRWTIFRIFLRLGLTSFGGPLAHLGYLREEFVHRRRWLDEARFAQLLALCQFLPGPASSQMGFAIGLFRGGWRGAMAAFVGFTLPSAVLMFAFATLAPLANPGWGVAAIHGLKLVAVVVVAGGLIGMARQLTPDVPRMLMAVATAALILLAGHAWVQLVAIALGGLVGLRVCRHVTSSAPSTFAIPHGRRAGVGFLALFGVLLCVALFWPRAGGATAMGLASAFYRAGALVFGGGHVVLPLLQHGVVDAGWLDPDTFLAGYGAAQAMPGPMFSIAAFLGAEIRMVTMPLLGATIALLAVFLPGFLLLLGVLPFWTALAGAPWAAPAISGINAAVVGLLLAALYDPVWTGGVHDPIDVLIVVAGVAAMTMVKVSPLWIVLACVGVSIAETLLRG